MLDFLGSQIFHIIFYVYKVDGCSKPLIFQTTYISKYKSLSPALLESESLGGVYPVIFGGTVSSELIVVPLILMAVTPVRAKTRTLGLFGDPE